MAQGLRPSDRGRVYAIGDIHGRDDLLGLLLDGIAEDARCGGGGARTLVFLGDYVDRGLHSRQVLDRLSAGVSTLPMPARFIRGNHDQTFLEVLAGEQEPWDWLGMGGQATLYSYGIEPPKPGRTVALDRFHDDLTRAVPLRHRQFLEDLEWFIDLGDYFFVHAGVRPGVPLTAQLPDDLLYIRSPFLSSKADFGRIVVHGHSLSSEPQVCRNRIGIDTGAFATGRLTCLVIEAAGSIRFLST